MVMVMVMVVVKEKDEETEKAVAATGAEDPMVAGKNDALGAPRAPSGPPRTAPPYMKPYLKPSRSDPTLLSSYGDDLAMLMKPPYHHVQAMCNPGGAGVAGAGGFGQPQAASAAHAAGGVP